MHTLDGDLQCLGIDNTTLVPPLLGAGRHGGAAFGALLQGLAPGALMAYAPVGILDDPVEPASRARAHINSATRVTSPEVLEAALWGCGMAPLVPATPAERAHHLGHQLSAVARSGYHEWHNAVRARIMERRVALLRDEAMNASAAGSDYGSFWRAAGDRYRNAFISAAESPRFFVPAEFDHIADTPAALSATGELIGRFGDLLQVWPAMWSTAAEEMKGFPTRF